MVSRFSVKWTPTVVVLDPSGDEHHRFIGFLPPEDFIGQLILGKGKTEFNLESFDRGDPVFPGAFGPVSQNRRSP